MNRSPVLFTPSLTHSHNTKLPLLFLPHWRHHRFVCARTKRTLVETKGSTVLGVKRWCGKPGSAWLGQSSLACLTTFSWQDRGRTPTLIGPRRQQKSLSARWHVGAEQGWFLEIEQDDKYETGVGGNQGTPFIVVPSGQRGILLIPRIPVDTGGPSHPVCQMKCHRDTKLTSARVDACVRWRWHESRANWSNWCVIFGRWLCVASSLTAVCPFGVSEVIVVGAQKSRKTSINVHIVFGWCVWTHAWKNLHKPMNTSCAPHQLM